MKKGGNVAQKRGKGEAASGDGEFGKLESCLDFDFEYLDMEMGRKMG